MSAGTSFGDEPGRLRSLLELDVLDSPAELEFDRVVRAAALICGVPISLISLIDRDRQWFKANIGLAGVTETPREFAFCARTIAERGILEVADASLDTRFATNPLVTDEPNIRFYAGATLRLSDGAHVGTLCVIDRVPRVLDNTQRELLELLAEGVVSALEHRQALRSYADSNSAFRAMVDSAPDAMVSVDTNQRVVQFNRAAEKMFACAATDAIGKPLETFIPARFRAAHASHLRAFGQSAGAPRAMHSPGRLLGLRTDGSEFPIEASISQTRVRGKQVFTSVLRDVTERAMLEAEVAARSHELHRKNVELSEADQQLRTAQQISKVGSWEFDPATGVVLWSEQLFRIVNVDEQAGVPQFPAQERLYMPESWQRLSEAVRCALETGAPYELELELVARDGERRWAVARGEVRAGAAGAVVGLAGTLQDVTELKRARLDLERLSRRLQVATAGAGVGIWDWDLEQNSISVCFRHACVTRSIAGGRLWARPSAPGSWQLPDE
ncbi:MAG: hypothetical protein RLZZ450_3864, partial [Pseudomonadota bacterium]